MIRRIRICSIPAILYSDAIIQTRIKGGQQMIQLNVKPFYSRICVVDSRFDDDYIVWKVKSKYNMFKNESMS